MSIFIEKEFISYVYRVEGVNGKIYQSTPITWDVAVRQTELANLQRTGSVSAPVVSGEVVMFINRSITANINRSLIDQYPFSMNHELLLQRGQKFDRVSNTHVFNSRNIQRITVLVEYPNEDIT